MANLIGTAPNQVPTNGDLGTMAFQDTKSVVIESLTVNGTAYIAGGVREKILSPTGTSVSLDPANGSIHTQTLSGNTTYTFSGDWNAGESLTLMIDDGSAYTVTWPTMTWVNNGGAAPTLATTGYTTVVIWKISTTFYGAVVGTGA